MFIDSWNICKGHCTGMAWPERKYSEDCRYKYTESIAKTVHIVSIW